MRLAEQVGRGNVVRAARDLGIDSSLTERPSLALGTSGVSLLELTAAYAAVAGGRYPVEPRGLPPTPEEAAAGMGAWFARGGRLDDRRDRGPMLDLLWAAANRGTGRRAAISTATFGKTGTTQNNRDALFIGFAGDLVVGVWVGRDDNRSLGKITGGTAPADIWRRFMGPAVAIDGRRGPPLPPSFHIPERRPSPPADRKSPLPDEWSEGGDALRQFIDLVEQFSNEF